MCVTPLMKAAAMGRIEIAKILLEAGANPEDKDLEGQTYMDYAKIYDKYKFIYEFREDAPKENREG
jgi:ankyrin repeat protein